MLQFGADAVVLIDDPSPWQQRLIRELESGIPDAALGPVAQALGAPDGEAEAFVRRIRRALARPSAPSYPVGLQAPEGFSRTRAAAVRAALASAGLEVSELTWFGAPGEVVPGLGPVVVLADHIVEPRRAAALMGADVPHLPLVFTGAGAEVGPYVRPGRSPCLACLAAHRTDADPAWPHLAAQLIGRPAPQVSDALATEAALATANLLGAAGRGSRRLRAVTVTLREGSLHRVTRAHRPHAACRCRSLGGIATAGAPAFPATTTATASAPPA